MTWTKLSDTFSERLDLMEVSRDARLLHVEALIWCNRHTTDGKLPAAFLRRITDAEDPRQLAAELVAAEVWTVREDAGWDVDWTDQERSTDVHTRRAEDAARKRRSRLHRSGDHSECRASYCKQVTRPVTRDRTVDTTGDATPSRPTPARPLGRDGGKCPHGVVAGAQVLGSGPGASRRCPDCESAQPAPYEPPQERAS